MPRFCLIASLWLTTSLVGLAQTLTVAPSATTYLPSGGEATFAVNLAYPEPLSSAGVSLRAPAGWSFQSATGAGRPQILPVAGTTGAWEFAYLTVPASPVQFTITATYVGGLSGTQTFSEIGAILRPVSGGRSDLAHANIVLLPSGSGGGTTVAPSILSGPSSLEVDPGQTAMFTVAATGSPPLAYQWQRNGVNLPGATGAALTLTNVNASSAGSYTVAVSNSVGVTVSTPASLMVRTPSAGPTLVTQPTSAAVAPGASVTFSVVATGTAPLAYQWRKDGQALSGQTGATLHLSNVSAGSAGSYTVVVSNSAGSVTSAAATLVVRATPVAPTIVIQPASVTAVAGGAATLSVSATGDPPLAYQWHKDGQALTGQTNSTFVLNPVQSAAAGSYVVVVSNAAGSVTSNSALLSVSAAPSAARAAFGALGADEGWFAIFIRADRTAVFLAYTRSSQIGLVADQVVVDDAGGFRATARAIGTGNPARLANTAASEIEYGIEGSLAPGGAVSGSIAGLGLAFSAPSPALGASGNAAGHYRAGAVGKSADADVIIGGAGEVFILMSQGGSADLGRGTLGAASAFSLTTERSARVAGVIQEEGSIAFNRNDSADGETLVFSGADSSRSSANEKLVNISTRSQTGPAESSLIAGFVVSGTRAKPVLLRAVGPSLAGFGVGGAISTARIQLFRGDTLLATGDDWGRGGNAAAISAAAVQVGAFALPAGSRDAALLVTLEPGAYTGVATGQGGESGVTLIEVYDAEVDRGAAEPGIVNISTRGQAGGGDEVLVGGFVIRGSLPKRVLVRGIGPALSGFGVAGALSQPRLSLISGEGTLAQNNGWSDSPDAEAIAAASTRVGAFALRAGSRDAALIINLAAGAYTAQIESRDGVRGIALLEVYEVR